MTLQSSFRRHLSAARYRPDGGNDLSTAPEAQPILLDGRRPTVLCIHGFGGVPGEVALATEVAAELGLAAHAPLLRGHGSVPKDLASTGWDDWLIGVREAFDEARQDGPVLLVGMSLGSLLATQLVLDAPGDVAGLALVANAFWLNAPYPSRALDLVRWLGVRDFGVVKRGADIADPTARASHVSYGIQPTHAAISVLDAGRRMRGKLFRVHCPTLLLHGALDRVCPVSNAWKVASALGTEDRRVVIFPESRHILMRDMNRGRVADELRSFFERFVPGETSSRPTPLSE